PLPEGEVVRELLGWTDTTARPQVDVALKHPICLLANALGPPPKDIVDLAHEHGVKVAALIEDFPFGPQHSVFKVGGKMFALSALDRTPLEVSVKCEPELAVQLRDS